MTSHIITGQRVFAGVPFDFKAEVSGYPRNGYEVDDLEVCIGGATVDAYELGVMDISGNFVSVGQMIETAVATDAAQEIADGRGDWERAR